MLQAASENEVVMVVSIPGVTAIGAYMIPSRAPFGHSNFRVIPLLSGRRVSVYLPSESVRKEGSSTLTPLLRMRRTPTLNPASGWPVSASVTTPWTRRGLYAIGLTSAPR
jgi:hypothetical protein